MWILFSLLAAACFTGIFLMFKRLDLLGVPVTVSLTWLFFLATLLYFAHLSVTKQSIKVSVPILCILAISAVLSYLGNLFQFKALALAPNPGYAVALISTQALLVTVVSIFMFGSDFSLLKGFGVFFCVCGVMLLSLAP